MKHVIVLKIQIINENMDLHEQIKGELAEALKAQDQIKLRTIRSMLTAFTNELVSKGKTPRDTLSDDKVLGVIKRLAKQRKDSIAQYEAANRGDLSMPEQEELVVLSSYLPKMMSQDKIKPIAKKKIAELGDVDKSKMGMVIGSVMKELGGKADGDDVKAVVEELLK